MAGFVDKAREAAKKKNYDYAVEMYNEHLKLTPGDVDSRKELRLVERERFRLNPPGMLSRAKIAAQVAGVKAIPVNKKDPEKTMIACEDVLKLDPTAVPALLKLGEAASHANQNDVAIYVFEDALTLDGKSTEGLRLLGRVYGAVGFSTNDLEKLQKSQACFEKLMRVSPNDKEAQDEFKNVAAKIAMMGKQNKDGSVKGFTDLIDKDKAAKLEKSNKRVRNAEDAVVRIAEVEEEIVLKGGQADAKTWRELATWAEMAKQPDRALEFCDKALEVDPKDFLASELKGSIKIKRYDETIKKIGDALKKSPEGDETLQAKLEKVKNERSKFCIEEYARRVESHPTDPGERYALGKALFEADQIDEAIKQLQQAKADPRRKSEAGLLLGQCFGVKKKIYALAVKELEAAREELVEMDDLKKNITYLLGRLHEAAKKPDKALAEFSLIAETDYNFKDVTTRMEKLGSS